VWQGMRLNAKIVLSLCLLGSLFACRSGPRVILKGGGKAIPVKVEIADTHAKRTLGLQYRQELGEDQGMLFLFAAEKVQTFWMKNTPISLDLIFINSRKTIVGIVHKAVPFSTASLSVSSPSQFVLEIKGGVARQHNIKVGDTVRFEGIDLSPVE